MNDQILLILNGFDHKFKKYQWRAKYVLELLTPRFNKLKPNLRYKILDLLSAKSNERNIQRINSLIFRNLNSISDGSINKFVAEQFERKRINPKMAIGYFRRFKFLDDSNSEKLVNEIMKLEKGLYILSEI